MALYGIFIGMFPAKCDALHFISHAVSGRSGRWCTTPYPFSPVLLTTLHKVVLNMKDCISPRIQVVPGIREDLMQCLLIDETYLLQ